MHPEESFAFCTKERAPFLLLLEVLDYSRPVSNIDASSPMSSLLDQFCSNTDPERTSLSPLTTKNDHTAAANTLSLLMKSRHQQDHWYGGNEFAHPGTNLNDINNPVDTSASLSVYYSQSASSSSRFADLEDVQSLRAASDSTNENPNANADAEIGQKLKQEIDHRDGISDASTRISTITLAQTAFREEWALQCSRIRARSPVGHLLGWRLLPVIVKSGDDLRQEQLVAQMVSQMHIILCEASIEEGKQLLRPYEIIALSPDSGLIEAIPDTISLDALRRNSKEYDKLRSRGYKQKDRGSRDTNNQAKLQRVPITHSLVTEKVSCETVDVITENVAENQMEENNCFRNRNADNNSNANSLDAAEWGGKVIDGDYFDKSDTPNKLKDMRSGMNSEPTERPEVRDNQAKAGTRAAKRAGKGRLKRFYEEVESVMLRSHFLQSDSFF